jgi:lipopolysaccharide/colanic/teichoic acid biosynthesis glycosyltransferase
MQRTLDILLSFVLGVLSLPVIALAALVIWVVDPGPLFYVQRREGMNGRSFRMWKLRTMYLDSAEILSRYLAQHHVPFSESAHSIHLDPDPRVVGAIGALMRRSRIDELPELWNVLSGDMTLVGPPPLAAERLERLSTYARRLRLHERPGMIEFAALRARFARKRRVVTRNGVAFVTERTQP